jgi:hypothetical protein
VVAVAYAITFAIVFIPLALLGLATQRGGATVVAGILLIGVVLLVVYPIVIWVGTALACLVYNLAARWVGGIEVQVERPPQMWTQSPGWMPPHPQPGWGPGPSAGSGTAPGAGPGTGQGGWTSPPLQGSAPGTPPYGSPQETWRPPSDPGDRR